MAWKRLSHLRRVPSGWVPLDRKNSLVRITAESLLQFRSVAWAALWWWFFSIFLGNKIMLSPSKPARAFCNVSITQVWPLSSAQSLSYVRVATPPLLTVTQVSDSRVNVLLKTCTVSCPPPFLNPAVQSREMHGSDLQQLLFCYYIQITVCRKSCQRKRFTFALSRSLLNSVPSV